MAAPATPIAPIPAVLKNLLLDIEPEDPTLLLEGALLVVLALLRTLLLLAIFSPRCFLDLEVLFLVFETVFFLEALVDFLETDFLAALLRTDFLTAFLPDLLFVFAIEFTR
jgi:hypothetical protein